MRRRGASSRAFLVTDFVLGLGLVAVLAAVLAAATTQQRRAQLAQREHAAALTRLELALLDLRAGKPAGAGVEVRDAGSDATASPAGWAWIEVSSRLDRGGEASLVGLVPAEATR